LFSSSESDDQLEDESLFKPQQKKATTTTTTTEKRTSIAHSEPIKNLELTKELRTRLSDQKANLFDNEHEDLIGNEEKVSNKSSIVAEKAKTPEVSKKSIKLFDDDSKSDDSDEDIFQFKKKDQLETTKKEVLNLFEDLPEIETDSKYVTSDPNRNKEKIEASSKTQPPPTKSIFSFSNDEESDEDSLFSFKKSNSKTTVSVQPQISINQMQIKQKETREEAKTETKYSTPKVNTSLFDDDEDSDESLNGLFSKKSTNSLKSLTNSQQNVSATKSSVSPAISKSSTVQTSNLNKSSLFDENDDEDDDDNDLFKKTSDLKPKLNSVQAVSLFDSSSSEIEEENLFKSNTKAKPVDAEVTFSNDPAIAKESKDDITISNKQIQNKSIEHVASQASEKNDLFLETNSPTTFKSPKNLLFDPSALKSNVLFKKIAEEVDNIDKNSDSEMFKDKLEDVVVKQKNIDEISSDFVGLRVDKMFHENDLRNVQKVRIDQIITAI